MSPVPVGAFSLKAVQWSNEGQVKAVLAPFGCMSAQPQIGLCLKQL
ncbi:MAG TPA: hypothetical protein V6D34_17055 [Candidatus Sericytochromatia bacterium]